MEKYEIRMIRDHKELVLQAAEWFHQKWGIPRSAYSESMEACLNNTSAIPQWYVVMDGEKIIAGPVSYTHLDVYKRQSQWKI